MSRHDIPRGFAGVQMWPLHHLLLPQRLDLARSDHSSHRGLWELQSPRGWLWALRWVCEPGATTPAHTLDARTGCAMQISALRRCSEVRGPMFPDCAWGARREWTL